MLSGIQQRKAAIIAHVVRAQHYGSPVTLTMPLVTHMVSVIASISCSAQTGAHDSHHAVSRVGGARTVCAGPTGYTRPSTLCLRVML